MKRKRLLRSSDLLSGVDLIALERQRQIAKEGWTPKHDDEHNERELARAASAYIEHYVAHWHVFSNEFRLPGIKDGPEAYQTEYQPDSWPWEDRDWNPQNPLRDLVKAGALIAAEIDRLQRLNVGKPLNGPS